MTTQAEQIMLEFEALPIFCRGTAAGFREKLMGLCVSYVETIPGRFDPIWIFSDGSAIRQYPLDDLFGVAK